MKAASFQFIITLPISKDKENCLKGRSHHISDPDSIMTCNPHRLMQLNNLNCAMMPAPLYCKYTDISIILAELKNGVALFLSHTVNMIDMNILINC